MKDLATALNDELQSSGAAKHEITELILDGKCRAADLSCLEGMDALTQLSLCNVHLKSLEGLPSLPKLALLNLADNKIKDGLAHLQNAGLSSLKVLSLAHNNIEDIGELQALEPLQLTHLDLCDCPLIQNTEDYRERVFEMLTTLQVLDNLDREGIDLLDNSDDTSEEEEEEGEVGDEDVMEDEDSEMEEEAEEPELLNLITDSEDDDEDEPSDDEISESEEIHVSVLAGPPILDDKSDDDQDYVMPENASESDEDSFESDEHISVSHHFAGGSSSAGPAPGGSSSDPSPGSKRKRATHGTEDLTRDVPQDEDYADI